MGRPRNPLKPEWARKGKSRPQKPANEVEAAARMAAMGPFDPKAPAPSDAEAGIGYNLYDTAGLLRELKKLYNTSLMILKFTIAERQTLDKQRKRQRRPKGDDKKIGPFKYVPDDGE